jgi:uncharacterized membrane protein YwaF
MIFKTQNKIRYLFQICDIPQITQLTTIATQQLKRKHVSNFSVQYFLSHVLLLCLKVVKIFILTRALPIPVAVRSMA